MTKVPRGGQIDWWAQDFIWGSQIQDLIQLVWYQIAYGYILEGLSVLYAIYTRQEFQGIQGVLSGGPKYRIYFNQYGFRLSGYGFQKARLADLKMNT